MPDLSNLLPETPEDDRIRKWREERAKIAEIEKAERLRLREEACRKEATARRDAKQAEVAERLPTIEDIGTLQKDMRRRARLARLGFVMQFALFCLLPWAATGYYLTAVATPLYEARSVIAVTTPSAVSEPTQNGLLGSLSGPSNLQDVFMAHAFIRSQAMMDALETEIGLVTRLSSDAIDPIQRLRDLPGLSQDKRQQFSRFVNSSVDIQSGLITLYVQAPDSDEAINVSETVLGHVAKQVSTLNADVIDQRLSFATDAVEDAQEQISAAQAELVQIQLASGEADPAERIAGIYTQIGALEAEVLALNNEIQRKDIQGQTDTFQLQRTKDMRQRLSEEIDAQRLLLISSGPDGAPSLNAILMTHELAQLRVEIAEEALSSALAAQADATQKAALARSLFQVVVPPRTASLATAPNVPAVLVTVIVATLAFFALWRVVWVGRRAY